MKKTIATAITTLSSLALASPIHANNIGVSKPDELAVTKDNFGTLISKSIQIIIVIAAIIAFVYLIYGGITWITSGGDKGKVEEARNRITHALIGIAIVAASWALLQIVSTFFGLTLVETLNIGPGYQ